MRGDEDDRQRAAAGTKLFLDLKTRQTRHTNIEQYAARNAIGVRRCSCKRIQERSSIREGDHSQPMTLQQPLGGLAKRRIVIDEKNRSVRHGR